MDPDQSYDNMSEDLGDESQQQTQSTQQASQQSNAPLDSHLWGYLQPCGAALTRIDFWKINPRYSVGRNKEQNQVVLPGFKVSNLHCVITWDGSDTDTSVVVMDLSSNGTFVNGSKIGKGQTCILHQGNEIAFGTTVPQPQNGGLEDYRFIYRHTASGPPTSGLYAFYDVGRELGKGSFGVVLKAMSRRTGEWVAVKMISESRNVRSPNETQNRPRSEIFLREVSILEQLKHPNICELKEVFIQEGSNDINMVLELVEGGDLLDHILKNDGLSEPASQHITYQLCDALSYIHSKNVAHRDLKPENVLLTKDVPPIVKVADFGLAKFVDSLTMLRTMCGTPNYLAPEVVQQQNNLGYDNLVDSWSIGVIVFSMLTGTAPFLEDDGAQDLRTRISQRQVQWGPMYDRHVSAIGMDFVRALLEPDPRERMTPTAALSHPWLSSLAPASTSSVPPHAPGEGDMPIDYSMISANTSVGPQASTNPPPKRASRMYLEATSLGKPMEDIDWDIVAKVTGQDAPKGTHKRVRSELTPLQEELMGAVTNEPRRLDEVTGNKQTSSEEEDDLYGDSKGKARGKTIPSSVKKPVRAQPATGDENQVSPTQPRRSARHPQKVARRF